MKLEWYHKPYPLGLKANEICLKCLEREAYIIEHYKKEGRCMVIRDPLYGLMNFSWDEVILMDTCYVQRLKQISQMGFIYQVFPSARHTRFEHTLGVVHLVKKAYNHLKEMYENHKDYGKFFTPEVEKTLIYSAMLHDIGHGPFSHAFEDIVCQLNEENDLWPQKVSLYSKNHEAKAQSIITNENFCIYHKLKDLLMKNFPEKNDKEINEMIADIGAYILSRQDPELLRRPLHLLINGGLDCDKLDYILRDAYHAGLKLGVDVDWIISGLRMSMVNNGPEIVFDEKVALSVLGLLRSRSTEGATVWNHHANLIANTMLRKATLHYINNYKKRHRNSLADLEDFRDYDLFRRNDYQLLQLLEETRGFSRDIAIRLRNRNFYKRVCSIKVPKATPLSKSQADNEKYYVRKVAKKLCFLSKMEEKMWIELRKRGYKKVKKGDILLIEIPPVEEDLPEDIYVEVESKLIKLSEYLQKKYELKAPTATYTYTNTCTNLIVCLSPELYLNKDVRKAVHDCAMNLEKHLSMSVH